MQYGLLDLETILRKIGRGVVFYAHDGSGPGDIGSPLRWTTLTNLQLAHLGDTEGDISFAVNGEVATLTLPEIAGQAIFDATHVGERPQLTIPLALADPNLLPIVSPTGQIGAGHIRVRDVAERSLVVFPEDLFRAVDEAYFDLSYTLAGGWKLNGQDFTAAQTAVLGMSLWLWRGYFDKPDKTFMGGHGDEGKNITPVTFNVMMHPDLPDGQRLYTVGDPALQAIDIEGGS